MKLHLIYAPLLAATKNVKQRELGEAIEPPLSILYLAAAVRKAVPNLEIKATDGLLKGYEKTITEIDKFAPDVIGISTATANATGAYKLSRWIKVKSPKTLVIMGGVHPTSLPQDVLIRSGADFVALGEGETILSEIIKKFSSQQSTDLSSKLSALSSIKGLAFLEKGKLVTNPFMPLISNLDSILFPARDLINLNDYAGWMVTQKTPETTIFSTRGCPFNCHFCSNKVWKLQKPFLRFRSPKNVMDEVEMLVKDYGIKEYFDNADEINSFLPWTIDLCQEKIKRKLTLPWKGNVRADKITPELARLLAKSNCWYVHLGIESGNQETLDGVAKHITLAQVIDCCRMLKKEKIKICGLFMSFNAWEKDGQLEYETVKDCENSLAFAKNLLDQGLIDNMTWSQATPYPGSALYHTAQKYKLIPRIYQGKWEYWHHTWGFVMKLPKVSEKDRLRIKTKGTLLQTIAMLKTGHLTLASLPFLLIRGLGLIKQFLLLLGSKFTNRRVRRGVPQFFIFNF